MSKAKILTIWAIITVLASSAAILTRYCDIPATSIGFWRVFGAGLVMFPLAYQVKKKHKTEKIFTVGTLLAGTFLGIHFATWCWAIQNTSIANATLFIGLQPLMVPFIAKWILGERTNIWEKIGVALALSGTIWLAYQQVTMSAKDIPGSAVALGSALLCSTYVVLGRKYRQGHNALVFSTGVFMIAAAVQAIGAIALHGKISLGDSESIWAIAGLIILPTIGGHGLSMYLLRYARPQLMSFTIPAQFVLATLVAFPVFHEIPPLWFYPGAILILLGVILGIVKYEA